MSVLLKRTEPALHMFVVPPVVRPVIEGLSVRRATPGVCIRKLIRTLIAKIVGIVAKIPVFRMPEPAVIVTPPLLLTAAAGKVTIRLLVASTHRIPFCDA